MIAYDINHDPPAIILSVVVSGVVHRRPQIEACALIDTGADVTAVPETFIEKLKLYPTSNSNYGNSPVGAGQAGNTYAKRTPFSPACLALFVDMIVGRGRDGAELASHVCQRLYRAIPPLQHNWDC